MSGYKVAIVVIEDTNEGHEALSAGVVEIVSIYGPVINAAEDGWSGVEEAEHAALNIEHYAAFGDEHNPLCVLCGVDS